MSVVFAITTKFLLIRTKIYTSNSQMLLGQQQTGYEFLTLYLSLWRY